MRCSCNSSRWQYPVYRIGYPGLNCSVHISCYLIRAQKNYLLFMSRTGWPSLVTNTPFWLSRKLLSRYRPGRCWGRTVKACSMAKSKGLLVSFKPLSKSVYRSSTMFEMLLPMADSLLPAGSLARFSTFIRCCSCYQFLLFKWRSFYIGKILGIHFLVFLRIIMPDWRIKPSDHCFLPSAFAALISSSYTIPIALARISISMGKPFGAACWKPGNYKADAQAYSGRPSACLLLQ